MKQPREVPIIFNMFPRYYKSIDDWPGVVPHVSAMGFNWIFVNPFHETGFSGSLYAIKNYYQLNPLFLKKGSDTSDFRPLKKMISTCNNASVHFMMDLVINHTAFDSTLVKTNPLWYKYDDQGRLVSPHAIDPANADNVTVWGDLAEIDNHNSKDKKNLWDYWDKLIKFFQEMGVLGFRCDAAYQVPVELWQHLIVKAKKRYPRTVFLAETLGCTMEQITELSGSGFDYFFNSSKYWEFDKPWCIEQHQANKAIAPSISFPESHDTVRLASEKPGTLSVQKLRYAFAALFSAGLLMPTGYEYGATTKIDVVKGTPKDVDMPKWDLGPWIKMVNEFKKSTPVLCEEGTWRVLTSYENKFLFLRKKSDASDESLLVCVNKDPENEICISSDEFPSELSDYKAVVRLCNDTCKEEKKTKGIILLPAELILLK